LHQEVWYYTQTPTDVGVYSFLSLIAQEAHNWEKMKISHYENLEDMSLILQSVYYFKK
jgi:hypothetical protein